MPRTYLVEEWRDGALVSPPLHDIERFADALDAFNREVASNPDRFLTMSQGRIIYKHPETGWSAK